MRANSATSFVNIACSSGRAPGVVSRLACATPRRLKRRMHEVVQDAKSGVSATSPTNDCTMARPAGMPNRTVAILGHSAGGWIVSATPAHATTWPR
jgi:hypothetical protein